MISQPIRNCHPFVERYEELRREAVGRASLSGSGQGMALVLRKGLTVWMQAWNRCAPSESTTSDRKSPGMEIRSAPGMQTELVQLLATMALGQVAARCGRAF